MNVELFRRKTKPLYTRLFFAAALLIFTSFTTGYSSEQAFLATYGSQAGTIEGDDDFLMVIVIRIPESKKQPFHIRIFDPDCGGNFDARYYGKWDTTTSFRVFGGIGACSPPGLKKPTPSKHDLESGILLVDHRFSENSELDGKWFSFNPLNPDQGEKIEQYRYFKLLIEGIQGDDGNRYLIDMSSDPDGGRYNGAEAFTYAATVHLPRSGVFAEMRFYVPKHTTEVTIRNFDLAGAAARLDTAFRTSLPVKTSGQNQWSTDTVRLDEKETGRLCALRFEGGQEMPNDASFYVLDSQGNILPIQLPVWLWKPNARPEPQLTASVLEDCVTVLFDASGSKDQDKESLQFSWNFGDGAVGSGDQIRHTYASPGIYRGYLIAEDTSGHVSNSALKEFSIKINAPPIAKAGPDKTAAPGEILEFNASESNDPDGKIVRYVWDFGNNQTAEGMIVRRQFDAPGTYPVTLLVEDNSGSPCLSAADVCDVIINAAPEPAITVERYEGRPTASVGEIIRFSAEGSRDPDGTIISFVWNFGDKSEKSGETIEHLYKKPGVYTVTLTVTDNSKMKNQTASKQVSVIVNEPPTADAGKDQKASVGETVYFDGSKSHDRDGTIIESFWDFGDGTTLRIPCQAKDKTCLKPSHVYDKPGSYRVSAVVKDASGSTSDTARAECVVKINAPPIAHAGDDQHVTYGEVRFDGSNSSDPDGQLIEYRWNFGDGSFGIGSCPVHVYQSPGQYTVSLTVTDDSGTSSSQSVDELMVIVNQLPIADAGPDQIGIPGKTIHFDGSGSVDPDGKLTSWEWNFGDGNRASGIRVSHIYHQPARYTVYLSVLDNSGHTEAVGYDAVIVIINAPPVAAHISDRIASPGDLLTFDGTGSYDPDGSIVSYHWEFSDGVISSASKFERRFDNPGLFTGVLTVSDNQRVENSISQMSFTIRINHAPTADAGQDILTSSRTILFDGSGSSDADGDPLIYKWNFGDGSEAVGKMIYHTYKKGGIYPVILTVNDTRDLKNSVARDSAAVKINDPPIADAGSHQVTCAGKAVIFDASNSKDPEGGLMKFDWDFGDGTSAQGINPVKIYDFGGIYSVTLTVTDDSGTVGNQSMDQITVKVVESPVANAGTDMTVCAGSPVQFDGTQSKDIDGLVNSYRWDFGDGESGGGATPVHFYSKPGVYRVRLTITGDRTDICNHIDSDELTVTVENAPVSDFLAPAAAEIGKPVIFEAVKDETSQINIMKWDWDFGDGSFGQGRKATHIFPKHGRFLVRLTVISDSETDCNKTSFQKTIQINAPPVAKAGKDPMTHLLVGVNEPVVFDGQLSRDPDGAIRSYTWDFGDGNTGQGIQTRHSYHAPGQYAVVLKVIDDTNLENNTGVDTMLVTVNDAPKPVISLKDTVCAGEIVDISGRETTDSDGEIEAYTWHFGDGSTAAGRDVQHVYSHPGTYVILLEVDDGRSVSNSRVQTSRIIVVNDPPVAAAVPDRTAAVDEKIEVDGSLSYDPDGVITKWKWDFGDGYSSEGVQADHRYQKPGVYSLRLIVQDNSNSPCSLSENIAVIRINSPPAAVAGKDLEVFFGGANNAVIFDASASFDPDGDPLTYQWDFGDGSRASGVKVPHLYSKPGQYRVTLTVDDGTKTKTAVSISTITVTVKKR